MKLRLEGQNPTRVKILRNRPLSGKVFFLCVCLSYASIIPLFVIVMHYFYLHVNLVLYIKFLSHEPFCLGRFAMDLCHAPQVNGRYASLLPTKVYFIGLVFWKNNLLISFVYFGIFTILE